MIGGLLGSSFDYVCISASRRSYVIRYILYHTCTVSHVATSIEHTLTSLSMVASVSLELSAWFVLLVLVEVIGQQML